MANTKIQSEQIQDGAITAAKIADGAIVAAELADNSVTTAKINADAVTGAKIADDAINSEHYTDGSIDTAHIADAQITVAKMAANSVDSDQYVDGSIDTAHIADANITTAKIADDAVTSAKIDTNIDIAGTFDVTGATTLDAGATIVGSGTGAGLYLNGTNSDSIAQGNFVRYGTNFLTQSNAANSDLITYAFNGSTFVNALNIKSNGNVGINCAGSNAKLEVVATSGEVFRADANSGAYRLIANQTGVMMNGNVGIGTTNPSQKLHVVGKLKLTDDLIIGGTNPRIDYDGGSTGSLRFFSTSANTERMRIESGGNVGIGTTSPSSIFHVVAEGNNGQRVHVGTSSAHQIYLGNTGGVSSVGTLSNHNFQIITNGASRLLVDSSGNTAIGVHNGTRAPQVLSVYMDEFTGAPSMNTSAHFGGGNNSSGYLTGGFTLGFSESGTNQGYRKVGIFAQGQGSGSAVQNLLLCVRTNTDAASLNSSDAKISISGTNGVASGDFNDTSDIGFKENIQDIPDSLSLVKQLQPRTFTWKGPKAGRGNSTGFIAQEVETVIPLLISGNNLGSTIVADEGQGEDGVDTIGKSINTIGLVAHLTKAIQELTTKLEAAEARITTLEGE